MLVGRNLTYDGIYINQDTNGNVGFLYHADSIFTTYSIYSFSFNWIQTLLDSYANSIFTTFTTYSVYSFSFNWIHTLLDS